MRTQLLLLSLLSVAVYTDVLHRRIPNALVAIGLLGGLSFAVLNAFSGSATDGLSVSWLGSLAGIVVGFLCLFPLYLMRACGAGDVKLLAMVGAFIGVPAVMRAAVYTLIAGGLLSLVFMFGKGVAAQAFQNIRFMLTDLVVRIRNGGGARLAPLAVTAARLPYAVAITLGTLVALAERNGWV